MNVHNYVHTYVAMCMHIVVHVSQEAMRCMKELCAKHFSQQQLECIQTIAGT